MKTSRRTPSRVPAAKSNRQRSSRRGKRTSEVAAIQRILVPVDFSPASEQAVHYAVGLARRFDAKIVLLHVRPIPYYPAELGFLPMSTSAIEPAAKAVRTQLEASARRLVPTKLLDRTQLRIGTVFDEICRAARALRTDLIVVSTHGYTGLKHVLLGSTAESVVRHASCPVLVVRARK